MHKRPSGRLVFIGPEWQVVLMKQLFGDAIDYIIQQSIPKGEQS